MRLSTDVVLLSRALVTVDGTLRTLVPDLSLVAAAIGMVDRKDDHAVVDRKELVRDELLSMLPHLRRLPERVDRILTLTSRGELRTRSVIDEDGGRILRTLANRLLLVFAGASFLTTSAWLLAATEDGPRIAGQTGLYEAFGYGGLLLGAVLVLRVVAAIARDGTT
jgi:ubiquinone biosynthesis protein